MGQVAIVTGGSSGIGAAAAEYLAAHGCTVYEFSRHEKSGGSASVHHVTADVTDEASVAAAVQSVLDAEGKPVLGEDGKRQKETLTVKPQEIKTALAEARKRYAEEHAKDDRGLAERAEEAKAASSDLEKGDASRPLDREGR